MAELIYNEALGEWAFRQMLRSPYIDYFNGRFFVTFQVYHNKSIFGAIVGEECVLNELGEAVRAAWLAEPEHVAGAVATKPPIISTFTSYYERQVLAKCLASGRRFIWVCPGGIGEEALAKTIAARADGRALLISPVSPGTGVNKQRANYCNQFIAQNAAEIWVGHVRPGGSLETILRARVAPGPPRPVGEKSTTV